MHPINAVHDYAMVPLSWVVEQPINGGTDAYVVAAFKDKFEAQMYADMRSQQEGPDEDYRITHVGSRYSSDKEA